MSQPSRAGRKPRDDIIRTEIRRRLAAGEPIAYRPIRGAVGGSPATIKRVLESMGLSTDARGNAEREIQVRDRLREAAARLAEAEAYVRGAKEAGEAFSTELRGALASVRDAHTILMRDVDTLRGLVGQLSRELAAGRPEGDPLLEARLKRANSENGRMSQRIEVLLRKLHEAGIETD